LPIKHANELNRLIVQNSVTGCALMVNRALLDRANPIPLEAVMHDWWLALVACAFGHIAIVSEPTMLYRQHDKNQLGARKHKGIGSFLTGSISLVACCEAQDSLETQQ